MTRDAGRPTPAAVAGTSGLEFEALARIAPVAVFRADRDGLCTYASDRWTELTGLTTDETLGHGWARAIHADDCARVLAQWETSVATGVPFQDEYRLLTASGVRRVRVRVQRVECSGDRSYIGVVEDLSALAEALQRARDERDQRAAVFSSALEAILVADDAGRYVDANPAATKLLGYSREELLTLSTTDVTVPELRDRLPESWSQFLRTGLLSGEHTMLCKDGSRRDVEFRSVAHVLPGKHFSVMRDITEERAAARDAEAQRIRLEAVFAQSFDGLVLFDTAGRYLDANPAACEILGYSRQELLTMSLWDVVDGSELETSRRRYARFLQDGELHDNRVTIRRKDGTTRVIEFRTVPNIAPDQHFSTIRDTTPQRRAAAVIDRQRELFQAVFDHIPVMVEILNREDGTRWVNPQWQRVLGYSADELADLDYRTLFLGSAEYERARTLLESGSTDWQPFRLRARNGRILETLWMVLRITGGTSLAFGLDITDRKRAEDALQYQAMLLANIQDAIVATDAGFQITAWNHGAEALYGWRLDEVLGRTAFELANRPPTAAPWPDVLRRLHEEGYYRGEFDQRRRDGSPLRVEVVALGLKNQRHQITGYVAVCRDVTLRHQAQEALRDSERRHRVLFENASEAIALTEAIFEDGRVADWIIRDVNPAYEAFMGIPRERAVGSRGSALLGTEPAGRRAFEDRLDTFRRVVATGETTRFEFHHPCRNRDFQGAIWVAEAGHLGITFTDVTDRKQVEQILLDRAAEHQAMAEERAAILDALPAMVAVLGPDARVRAANKRWMGFRGEVQGDMAIGRSWFELAVARPRRDTDLETAEKGIRQVLAGDLDGFDLEYPVRGNEPDAWVRMLVASLPGAGGAVVMYMDVSSRHQIERRLETSRVQLRQLLARSRQMLEDERLRLSRDLHDQIGQSLTALKIGLSLLMRRAGDLPASEIVERTQAMSDVVDAAIQTARRLASELRPVNLDRLGLTAALEWEATEFGRLTGLACEVVSTVEDEQIDQERSTELFRIAQEALTNVARHAQAKRVRISLEELNGALELTIQDDGIGLEQASASRNPNALGILGMRERAILIGGELAIGNAQPNGTTLKVLLPLDAGTRAERRNRLESGDDEAPDR